jgi:glutathione S-transferase
MRGQASDKAVFDPLIAGLSAKLDAYEVILGKQKYLAGNVSYFWTRLLSS